MTRKLNDVMYVDSANDTIPVEIEEVRSSVSYTLNNQVYNLTLNAPEDYEIKEINGKKYYVYGYPEKWEYDYVQGNGSHNKIGQEPVLYTFPDGSKRTMSAVCPLICCLNILIAKQKYNDVPQIDIDDYTTNVYDELEHEFVQKVINAGLCNTDPTSDTYGGANVFQIIDILKLEGVNAHFTLIYTVDTIATAVKEGRGVIVSIDSSKLQDIKEKDPTLFDFFKVSAANHSVLVTGVAYSSENSSDIAGFYICNSGGAYDLRQNLSYFVTKEQFSYIKSVLKGTLVITEPIKTWNKDIDGTGNSLDNVIKGTSGNNLLKGEDGNDVLVGNEGEDTIEGGSDNDVLIAGSAKTETDGVKTDLSNNELKALINQKENIDSSKFETEEGKETYLYGDGGQDLLIGDKGNDYLTGGSDNDYLYGGKGNDVLIGDEGTDKLYGGDNDDILIVGKHDNIDIEALKQIIYRRSQITNVSQYESQKGNDSEAYGDSGEDLLIGDKGNDKLYGGSDNDYLYGGKGEDTLYGDEGEDVIKGGDNNDTIYGGSDNDKLYGEDGNDEIYGDDGEDTIYGDNGDDTIDGGIGNDNIKGGANNDNIVGGIGNDTLEGGSDNDNITGGSGNDRLIAGSGFDYLYGGTGNDILANYENSSYLSGSSGYDIYDLSSNTHNTIRDDDANRGRVMWNNSKLWGANKEHYLGGYSWQVDNIHYFWDYYGNKVYITDLSTGGTVRVDNYLFNGALEIFFKFPGEPPVDVPPIETDPILFDLNGNGIKTSIYAAQGIHYDYNNDGFAEKISWATEGDGVLVVDANNDGKIQGSSDILTSLTLASYDTNYDGKINYEDEYFNNLKILTDEGTVLSMDEANISSIDITNIQDVDYVDENGNTCTKLGSFTTLDGEERQYGEYYLQTDMTLSQEVERIEETETIASLPDISNSGKVRSLHQAMLRDESLQTLVTSFTTETNSEERMNLVEQILLKWTGAENVAVNSRGEYINAQHLTILESFEGIEFVSNYEIEAGNPNPENPNKAAANMLRTEYEVLKNEIYANLMQQTHLQTYYDAIDKTDVNWDLSPVVALLQEAIEQDEATGRELVYQVAKMIKGLVIDNRSNFFDPKDDSCFYTTFTQNDRDLKWLIDTIGKVPFEDEIGDGEGSAADDSFRLVNGQSGHFHSLSGDDVIYGDTQNDGFAACSGNDLVDGGEGDDNLDTHGDDDIVWGGTGNDTVHSSDGNDIIFGGDGDDRLMPDHGDEFNAGDGEDIVRGDKGNDHIISVLGNDTIIFQRGDGQDIVEERQGVDTLYFGPDIAWEDLIFEQSENNMIIKINNTEDQITIVDWFVTHEDGVYRYDNNKIEKFEFADGSIHTKDEITIGDNTEAITYNMDEIGDWVQMAGGYKTVVNVKEGWNDINAGLNSDDTYVIDRQGSDVQIHDYSGNDTIRFGEGISLARTFFAYNQDHIEIWFEDYESHLRLRGNGSNYTRFEFADGTVVTDLSNYFERTVSYVDHIMGEREQEVELLGYDSVTVIGNDMDNRIIANEGDSVINAGQGRDEIISTRGGNNTYIINLNDGDDHIVDIGGADTIQFGEGITIENTQFMRNLEDNSLEIWFNVEGDTHNWITIENFFGSDEFRIENFVFADGSSITNVEEHLTAYASRHGDDVLELPENIREGHLRGDGHSVGIGNDLDNHFNGSLGDNIVISGAGNDHYHDDQGGNDKIVYNIGDGHDNMYNRGGLDAIIFGEGITKDMIRMVQTPNELVIWFEGLEDSSLCIHDYFADDNAKIELFKFADGSVIDDITPYIVERYSRDEDVVLQEGDLAGGVWDDQNLNVTGNNLDNNLQGNAGNNIMEGKEGNDHYHDDQGGDDTYVYNIGDGYDSIYDYNGYDKIKFGEGIAPENLRITINDGQLWISFNNCDGEIHIENYDADENNRIEVIEFADGTQITDFSPYQISRIVDSDHTLEEETVVEDIYVVGEESVTINGNSDHNLIMLNNGADITVQGNAGNDPLIDNAGGSTTYIYNVGDGDDNIYDAGGYDKIKFGQGISTENIQFVKDGSHLAIIFDGIDGSIFVENYFGSEENTIEEFEFYDETIITDISPYMISEESDVDYVLAEDSNIQEVYLVGENNINATGNSGDNYLQGNDADNVLESNGGEDIINPLGGNDTLKDSVGGNTTYIYALGFGDNIIEDVGGIDTIMFADDRINQDNVRCVQRENNLVIYVQDEEGSLTIKDFFTSDNNKVENFRFRDGSQVTDYTQFLSGVKSAENYTFAEETIVEEVELTGTADATVTGNSQINFIIGNEGNNTVQANGGDDVIVDTAGGNDTYIYNLGDGYDVIHDLNGTDKIKFGEGITTDNLRFVQGVNHLVVFFTDNEGEIVIENYMNDVNNRVEVFELSDGTQITDIAPYLMGEKATADYTFAENSQIDTVRLITEEGATVTGNSNDNTVIIADSNENTIKGNGGNDTVIDLEGGNTVYEYNAGDGNDYISDIGGIDTIKFGEGLSLENMGCLNQNGHNLEIFFDGNEGNVVIENYFVNGENRIERFEFADGTVIEDIMPYMRIYGSDNSVILGDGYSEVHLWGDRDTSALGTSANEHFDGREGNNTFAGGGGDDSFHDECYTNETYIYNVNNGHDHIYDVGGIDRIKFGREIFSWNTRFEQIDNNLEISFYDREGGITIENYFLDDDHKIEFFEFDDGEVLTDIMDRLSTVSPTEDYTLPEETIIDTVKMSGEGNISVVGNNADNRIIGNSGNNTFEGKGGNDWLVDDFGGNDTYIYNLSDGHDEIADIGGIDTIKFGEGITLENLAFMQTESDLNIWFHNIENAGLSIKEFYTNPDMQIERFELSDGTVITNVAEHLTAIGLDGDVTLPEGVSQAHLHGEGNTTATGNSGDNWMGGNFGDNTMIGGQGHDYLYDDQGGNDTYIYNIGDGHDHIVNYGGYDTIQFGEGITANNVIFIMNNGDLLINFVDNDGNMMDGSIRVEEYFYNDDKRIEKVQFADGSAIENIDNRLTKVAAENDIYNHWDLPEMELWGNGDYRITGSYADEIINSNSGSNIINAQGGNDIIYDTQGGDDTYIYNQDYNNKQILDVWGNDTIKFGSGLNLENTHFTRQDNNLLIHFPHTGESIITIQNYFNDEEDCKIENFEFVDGTVITDVNDFITGRASYGDVWLEENEIYAHLLGNADTAFYGNDAEENVVYGNAGNNTYNGGRGHDHIQDKEGGNDTYIYNVGDESYYIIDINGEDTIRFGEGISLENIRFNHRDNDLQICIDIGENGGNIHIENYFRSDIRKIEKVEFADGTIITDVTPYISGITIDSDYTIEEESNIRELYIRGNDNVSVVGNSNDNHFEGNHGNNTYQGNGGNDGVYDEQGDDTYIYNLGDGDDHIHDISGYDTIRFGEGITTENIRMNYEGGSLRIWFEGYEGSLFIEGFFRDDNIIEKLVLSDETEITDFTPYFNHIEVTEDYTIEEGSNIKDVYIQGENNVSVVGDSKDSHFEGNSANNTYQGNTGNDDVYDPEGDETYIYNLGDGHEFYNDEAGFDTLRFGEGITPEMLHIDKQDNGNMCIWFADHEGGVTICEHFWNENKRLEKIVFADGTEITDFSPYYTFVETSENYEIQEGSKVRDVYIQGESDVTIIGDSKDNNIIGNSGNNTYQGNGGNDFIIDDQGGNDVYIYNAWNGWDTIIDQGGYDVVRFGEGLTLDRMQIMSRNDDGIEIWFNDFEGNLVIENFLSNPDRRIERFEFFDGTVIENIEDYINCIASENDIVLPDGYSQAHLWGEGNTSATGNNSENHFNGNSGHNTFEGKQGDDSYWDDQGGDDTFIYNLGDGHDHIANAHGYDTIVLGEGITASMIRMQRDEHGNLNISFEGHEGNICIQDYFNNDDWKIERIVLSDNTEITDFEPFMDYARVTENYTVEEGGHIKDVIIDIENDVTVIGDSRDNHFEGGNGNDTFEGKAGNDSIYDDRNTNEVYIYNIGDGWDYITDIGGYDTVKFGEGLSVENMKVSNQNGYNLEIWFDGIEGNIVFEGFFATEENKQIERFEFADGTIITDITQYVNVIASESDIVLPDGYKEAHLWGESNTSATGNNTDNQLNGNCADNTFEGKQGNDNHWDDQGGNDTYIFNIGDGYDHIGNYGGYDVIHFGENITPSMLVMNRHDDSGLEIMIGNNGDGIKIQNYFCGDNEWHIEKLVFADGTEITDFTPYYPFVETSEDYTLPEDSTNQQVYANGDANVTLVGNSQDNVLYGNIGNNTIEGKAGNDEIRDYQGGDDTYIYNIGDGCDNLSDSSGNDQIQLGEGITENIISYMRDDYDNMHLQFTGYDGEILINQQFGDENNHIESIKLSDGTVITDINSRVSKLFADHTNIVMTDGITDAILWGSEGLSATGNSLNNNITGNSGNNIIEGKAGDDVLFDNEGGDDKYVYNIGDGNDIITDYNGYDTIQFGSGITMNNIRFNTIDGTNNLSITFEDIAGSIIVQDYFTGDDSKIEKFSFADGIDLTDISSMIDIGAEDVDPVEPNLPDEDEYEDEEEPTLPLPDEPIVDEEEPTLPNGVDINLLIQEMNSFGTDSDVVMSGTETQNTEELLLAMVTQ